MNFNNLHKEKPFKTPENYFEELESNLFLNIQKENSFEIPENYFESLEQKIVSKNIENKKGKIISFNYKKWVYTGIASSLIFGVFLFFNYQNYTEKNQISVQDKNQVHEEIYNTLFIESSQDQTIDENTEDVLITYYNALEENDNTTQENSSSTTITRKNIEHQENVTDVLYDLYINETQNTEENEEVLF